MPAALPPASAYTYAVDMSADQAVLAGAKALVFSQPVAVYVDDFLHFPVGQVVPVGYYDPDQGAWVASGNGRIVQILAVTGGLADLDIDGSGTAASRRRARERSASPTASAPSSPRSTRPGRTSGARP